MNGEKLTDKVRDFRAITEALRGFAADLWDAAECLEASYGMVCDALNDTMGDTDCMFILCTKPECLRRMEAATDAA